MLNCTCYFFYKILLLQHVTYHRIQLSIFLLWGLVTVLACLPFIGFGLYYDLSRSDRFKCSRYRFATQPQDVTYAYVVFGFGLLMCLCIVLCNLCVIHALCQMGKRSAARRISTRSINREARANQPPGLRPAASGDTSATSGQNGNYTTVARNGLHKTYSNGSQGQGLRRSLSYRRRDSSSSQSYHEEISFAKLMAVLCIFYVVCWLPQLISIPIGQRDTSQQDLLFFRLSDVLIALNFVLDPFIYVVLRASNGRRGCLGLVKSTLCCWFCRVSSSAKSEVQNTMSSTLAAVEAQCQDDCASSTPNANTPMEYIPLTELQDPY